MAAANPADGDLQYVAKRCLPDAQRKATVMADYARWPNSIWWINAAGYRQAEQGQWQEAADKLGRASENLTLQETVTVDLARVRRMLARDGLSAQIRTLAERSVVLKSLLNPPSADAEPTEQAFSKLAAGHLDEAIKLAEGTPAEAVITRLVAASVGASTQQIARGADPASTAVALDTDTMWSSMALAAREGRTLKPYEDYIAGSPWRIELDDIARIKRFLKLALAGKSADAEAALHDLPPFLRGQAYVMGVVARGSRAPQAWRDNARFLLFERERPYLG